MRNKKTIMIGILCTLVAIMAVGYALLAQQLNINGRASIDSTWKVEITNITEKDIVGDATSKEVPSYTATTANFSVGLIQPGDSITYEIEISNLGTLKAKVDSINVVMDENNAITYTTSGIERGTTLGVNEKNKLTVTVAYNPTVTSQPTNTVKDITVTINYVQDLGTSNEPSTAYDTYSRGDQISFAGSNWYVIKDSTSEEDYVTLLKEKVLTHDEIGENYATSEQITCGDYYVENGYYGCTTAGETVTAKYDTMAYYWSDTCHHSGVYGYTDWDTSGCEGHNDYEGSKVKEFLEGTYINTIGSDKLKEVDGYKIRLITKEEILGELGGEYENLPSIEITSFENVPIWVYQNFGNTNSSYNGYWTMTPSLYDETWTVEGNYLQSPPILNHDNGVRPVINLLKSSI